MKRCTQSEAWRRIRACTDAYSDRLVGRRLVHADVAPVPPGTLDPAAAQLLHDSIYRPLDEPAAADMIFYVVSSDGTPMVWLTHHARVVIPAATLTPYQMAHQARAVEALTEVSRHVIYELVILRDERHHRRQRPPDPGCGAGHVLVADPVDRTRTCWTRLSTDLHTSHAHLGALTGAAGDVYVVAALGYGAYGQHRAVLQVPVLCAIEALADTHTLPTAVVGDWLHEEGATRADPTPDQITEAFTAAYAGVFPTRRAYAEAELDRRGWRSALANAGIPVALLDIDRFAAQLFDREARAITLPGYDFAVFRRQHLRAT